MAAGPSTTDSSRTVEPAVVTAVHNRAALTRRFLEGLAASSFAGTVVVFDDGSSDATPEVLAAEWPFDVQVLRGDGEAYWAGGMRAALSGALAGPYDPIVLANDDTELDPDAVDAFLQAMTEHDVLVGPTVGPEGGLTYGGLVRTSRLDGLKFTLAPLGGSCDTFHANWVGITRSALEMVDPFPPWFVHNYGDIDLGLQLMEAGCDLRVWSRPIGVSPYNTAAALWQAPGVPPAERFRLLLSPKGLPPRQHFRACRDHAGPLWPVHFLEPYGRALAIAALEPFSWIPGVPPVLRMLYGPLKSIRLNQ